eukprot:IDg15812t1
MSTRTSGKLINVTKCIRREHIYSGLPYEDFDAKVAHFRAVLDMEKIEDEADRVAVIPFLDGSSCNDILHVTDEESQSLESALKLLKATFLSEEATIWESLNFHYIERVHGTKSKGETLRKIFTEVERFRNCTSQALKAD